MLIVEKQLLRKSLPRLADLLADCDLLQTEAIGAETLTGWFRDYGSPGFLVPRELGGKSKRLADLAPVCSAVAAACPSLAVIMLMHHHTVGAFCFDDIPVPRARSLLESVAGQPWLVGSAFAESRKGVDLLDSSVICTRSGDGFLLNGSKKPCTMSHHADVFLVGVTTGDGPDRNRGLAFVERSDSRIETERFWTQSALASTDSECVRFVDTWIPADNVLLPETGSERLVRQRFAVSQSEITISTIFQLLMSSSYLGVATRLCSQSLAAARDDTDALMYLTCEIEAARLAQYRLADMLDGGNFSSGLLGQAMALSYNAIRRIDAVMDAASRRPEVMAIPECEYLVRICGFMKRHPPSENVRHRILTNCYLSD